MGNGENCFMRAARGRKTSNLRFLDEKFPYLKNMRANNQHTALTLVVQFADWETIQFLIEDIKMSVNETRNGENFFLHAAFYGKVDTLRYLNSKNSNLKNDKLYQDTALTTAAYFADYETV